MGHAPRGQHTGVGEAVRRPGVRRDRLPLAAGKRTVAGVGFAGRSAVVAVLPTARSPEQGALSVHSRLSTVGVVTTASIAWTTPFEASTLVVVMVARPSSVVPSTETGSPSSVSTSGALTTDAA